jgi:hypothetical protein
MGLDFINRVMKTTLVFVALAFAFLAVYVNYNYAFSVLIGGVWSVLNLFAIKLVIVALVTKGKKNIILGLLVLFLKIPVLYGIGYYLLTWDYLVVSGLLWGFSSILLVAVLKALSSSLLKSNKIANAEETKA